MVRGWSGDDLISTLPQTTSLLFLAADYGRLDEDRGHRLPVPRRSDTFLGASPNPGVSNNAGGNDPRSMVDPL